MTAMRAGKPAPRGNSGSAAGKKNSSGRAAFADLIIAGSPDSRNKMPGKPLFLFQIRPEWFNPAETGE